MSYLIASLMIVAGIIHLLPIAGALGASHLVSLYGVEVKDSNLLILMRHRAVLFAILGAFLVYSAFTPSFQNIAILGGLISATAFLWIAVTTSDYNSNMTRVVYADIIAIICLLIAALISWLGQAA